MLPDDIIQPSKSPWVSLVAIVKTKGGSLRYCVNYRTLNSVTQKDVNPLPRIDDTLDRLRHANISLSMDLKTANSK